LCGLPVAFAASWMTACCRHDTIRPMMWLLLHCCRWYWRMGQRVTAS
jgi:hypothetical protein